MVHNIILRLYRDIIWGLGSTEMTVHKIHLDIRYALVCESYCHLTAQLKSSIIIYSFIFILLSYCLFTR